MLSIKYKINNIILQSDFEPKKKDTGYIKNLN